MVGEHWCNLQGQGHTRLITWSAARSPLTTHLSAGAPLPARDAICKVPVSSNDTGSGKVEVPLNRAPSSLEAQIVLHLCWHLAVPLSPAGVANTRSPKGTVETGEIWCLKKKIGGGGVSIRKCANILIALIAPRPGHRAMMRIIIKKVTA